MAELRICADNWLGEEVVTNKPQRKAVTAISSTDHHKLLKERDDLDRMVELLFDKQIVANLQKEDVGVKTALKTLRISIANRRDSVNYQLNQVNSMKG